MKIMSKVPYLRSIYNKAQYALKFNTAVRFVNRDWYVNERILEGAFVHKVMPLDGNGKRVLDFGCTRSEMVLQLASFGYEVCGIDLREYEFNHPNLTFVRQNLLTFEDQPFDYITSISVLEHVGLGAYQEDKNEDDLNNVIKKLAGILKPGGQLIITVPCGKPSHDDFLRSFHPGDIRNIFSAAGLTLTREYFFMRIHFKYWMPCSPEEIEKVSNKKSDRGPTGVNGVGGFVFQKMIH